MTISIASLLTSVLIANTMSSEEMEMKDCLVECSQWMYNKDYDENPCEDADEKKNRADHLTPLNETPPDRDPWILPGYFNTLLKPAKLDGTPKVTRTIAIPSGRRIFCVVASSHATKFETTAVMGKTNPSTDDLKAHANKVHNLWSEARLVYDGVAKPLRRIPTESFEVNIPDVAPSGRAHPYVDYYKNLKVKPGDANMVSVGHVAMLPAHDGSEHTIDFLAKFSGDAVMNEIAYEISVRYNVVKKEEY